MVGRFRLPSTVDEPKVVLSELIVRLLSELSVKMKYTKLIRHGLNTNYIRINFRLSLTNGEGARAIVQRIHLWSKAEINGRAGW